MSDCSDTVFYKIMDKKVRFSLLLKFLCSSSPEEKLNDRRMLDISAKKIIDDGSC